MLIAVISEDAFPVHVNILMQVAGEYAGDPLLDKKIDDVISIRHVKVRVLLVRV